MATKKITKEEKLAQIEEARKCYEEAQKLIKQGDELIKKYMRGVVICGHDEFEPLEYKPYKDMISVHLFTGIGRFEKLFGVKGEPRIYCNGEKGRGEKALCIGGIRFFQLGEATQSRYNYR